MNTSSEMQRMAGDLSSIDIRLKINERQNKQKKTISDYTNNENTELE